LDLTSIPSLISQAGLPQHILAGRPELMANTETSPPESNRRAFNDTEQDQHESAELSAKRFLICRPKTGNQARQVQNSSHGLRDRQRPFASRTEPSLQPHPSREACPGTRPSVGFQIVQGFFEVVQDLHLRFVVLSRGVCCLRDGPCNQSHFLSLFRNS